MKKTITILFISVYILSTANAQSKQETAVADAVQRLHKAMISADQAELEKLVSGKLSYGHSSGHVDNKREFVEKIVSGRSDFISIDMEDVSVSTSGKTAVVRHVLHARTNDNGKPGEVHLRILLVWQKQYGQWILLARQAVKIQ